MSDSIEVFEWLLSMQSSVLAMWAFGRLYAVVLMFPRPDLHKPRFCGLDPDVADLWHRYLGCRR